MNPKLAFQAIYRDIIGTKTEPRSDRQHLEAAIEWLYRSQNVTDCHGSSAYYSLITGWAGPYPETSGYIVPTLYDYADWTGNDEARIRAERMAEWLLGTQLDSGAFPAGTDPTPSSSPSVFNTGQIVLGLVRAAQETRDERYRESIERAGRWLVEVQHGDGYWDRFDYRGEIHSYCSRVAWALLEAASVTGNGSFKRAADTHLNWVLTQQTETGWFEHAAFSPNEIPFTHTIAYTTRGLLEGGLLLDDHRYVRAARDAADALLTCHERDGTLRGAYDRNWNGPQFECLPGTAQVALLWLRLAQEFDEPSYVEAAEQEIAHLKSRQPLTGPPAVRGALKGSHPVWGQYMRLRYPNWGGKFLADALMALQDSSQGDD